MPSVKQKTEIIKSAPIVSQSLTPEIQKAICEAIRHGATYQAAAEASGVAYETFNNWRKDTRPKFLKFFNAVTAANADAQLDLLAKISNQSDKDWRAAAWILERRFKNDFGAAVDVTSGREKVTGPQLSDADKIARMLALLKKANGSE